jgi:transcriptional regulator with PAS, ATPase and Fis domain/Fe-S-cluster-containing hydrogenase component 2
VKALRVKNGQAEVIEERCINCTNCVTICSQGAKEVKNYKEKISAFLKDETTEVVIGLAPSFPAFDTDLSFHDWENILLKAGFKDVYEVAWGAQLIINEYQKYLAESDEPVISTACPVVVNYIRKYHPDLVQYLAPIVSPMGALVRYLEKVLDNKTKVVLVGPCHAKKSEFIDYKMVEGVLTYTEFFNMIEDDFNKYQSKIQKDDDQKKNLSSIINKAARQVPIAGGLKGALNDQTDDRYLKVEGNKKLSALFEMMSTGELRPKFVDALFCDGCINGVDLTEKSHFKKEIAVNKYIRNGKKDNQLKYRKDLIDKVSYKITFSKDYQKLKEPSENEIWDILAQTNKYSEEDLLNCGACGYDSCKEKAAAVYQGLAEVEMCLPYLLNEKRSEVKDIKDLNLELDSIINSSYDGMLVVNKDLKIERFNSAYLKMVNLNEEQLSDLNLNELEDKKIIYPSAALLAFKEKRNITIVQNTNKKRLLTTATPVFSEDDEIIRVIVNARDIKELDMAVDNDYSSSAKIKLSIESKDDQFNDMSSIVCKSEKMKRIIRIADKIGDTNSTVLISGDSGVGKEVIARYIHQCNENREDFVKINCGAIPERLLESELFGYETGAFSGARREGKPGLIEKANNGTLFLDEIGEMPLNMQVKLLQVIQEHKVTRIGGVEPISVDFRLITATNRNLKEMVESGNFREDLFYRLNVIPINVPPLTERPQDIIPLFEHYSELFNNQYDKEVQFDKSAQNVLLKYEWPGNVREMINLLERVIVTAEDQAVISGEDIKDQLNVNETNTQLEEIIVNDIMPLKEAVNEVEKKLISLAQKEGKSTYEIADMLGVNQSTIVRKMKKYFH